MKLAFMGTPDFAVPSLAALLGAGHEIARVYTQPPRPAGRGRQDRRSPVHDFAAASGLAVETPETLKGNAVAAALAELDLVVVTAYGLILPRPVLDAPRLGCINVHASVLPRWRGAAPIQRAILAGDAMTGITIMEMAEELDVGPILLTAPMPIDPDATAGLLHDGLARLGAKLLVEAVAGLEAGRIVATPQPDVGATYAEKITPADARVDWSRPAVEIERQVRAMAPVPGAWFEAGGVRVKLLAAEVVAAEVVATEVADGEGAPGAVLDDGLLVACGDGALRLARLQRAGAKALDAADYLRGHPTGKGEVFE
ncbi:MAG: methionyl-tRNA formyltransferase [Alphaproteobacteria bacterium]|nr:methionyl-tRNA formyltransferase [Alphaproteobacteria bacterium]